MHVENTITIERPIEEVFEYVSTPENDPTWVSASIRNQRTSPGPMRVGMTTEEDVKIFGRTSRDTWEVTEYEPPTVIAYRATSGLLSGGVVRVRCEPVEGGTRLTHAVEYERRARPRHQGRYRLVVNTARLIFHSVRESGTALDGLTADTNNTTRE